LPLTSTLFPYTTLFRSGPDDTVAFVPLAMPLMFGPGAIATVLGMTSFVRHPFAEFPSLAAIVAAILLTMITTYLILAYADAIVGDRKSTRLNSSHLGIS